jgi:hypothetical protein
MVEVTSSSDEMLVDYHRATRRYIAEGSSEYLKASKLLVARVVTATASGQKCICIMNTAS